MSASTPEDLAVSFRSLARRRREAIGDVDPSSVSHLMDELQRHVDAAAAVVGSGADAGAVADAIARRRSDDWDEATLDALRRHALDAGAVLRRIAAVAEAEAEEE